MSSIKSVKFIFSLAVSTMVIFLLSACGTLLGSSEGSMYQGALRPAEMDLIIPGNTLRTAEGYKDNKYLGRTFTHFTSAGTATSPEFAYHPYKFTQKNKVCFPVRSRCWTFYVDEINRQFVRESETGGLFGESDKKLLYVVSVEKGDPYNAEAAFEKMRARSDAMSQIWLDVAGAVDREDQAAAEQRRRDCINQGKSC